jgi:hypothetical protein
MRRREIIVGLGSLVAWPLAVRAQQRAVPVIGFVNSGSAGNLNLAEWLRRGPERDGRVPLAGEPIRSASGADG